MTTPAPVRSTANPSPVRKAGSIRRTSSIDVTWTDGMTGPRILNGRARDVLRPADGSADVIRAEAQMQATITFDRVITAISADPSPPALGKLVGEKGGGHLRGALRDLLPELIAQAHPLYLLLDDISGTSLVANWGWSQWGDNWIERMHQAEGAADMIAMMQQRQDVCWGFREGSAALDPEQHGHHRDNVADGKELRNPLDTAGWHAFPEHEGMSFRRARRIDVWREHGKIGIEASFQDSAPRPDGGRAALHEYIVRASVDAGTGVIESIEPEPRVLPFGECPGAIPNARALAGTPLSEIREAVLDRLRGPQGCTHLNDALRALGDVPELVGFLEAAA